MNFLHNLFIVPVCVPVPVPEIYLRAILINDWIRSLPPSTISKAA
jgi:hypothetical protein